MASNAPSSPLTVALSGTGTAAARKARTAARRRRSRAPCRRLTTTPAARAWPTTSPRSTAPPTATAPTASTWKPPQPTPAAAYDLGWTAAGQWFKYTVNVATAGTYTVSLRLASPSGVTDGLHIASSSGTNLSGNINVPATGGWQTWATATANVTLPAGQQTLTVDQDNAGWNIHTLAFAAGSSTTNLALNAAGHRVQLHPDLRPRQRR